MNMYEVCAKCGHVGKNNYIEKVFAIKASSGKEAAAIARQIPRVKHHHKDAIRYVIKIDKYRYEEIRMMNGIDPYLHCSNVQEQRRRCALEIKREYKEMTEEFRNSEKADGKKTYYKKKELRNPKKYITRYAMTEEYVS